MIALIDANSFFASCEQVYRPDLRGKPVVVLSNNDGCVIARNAEAKLLGIPMGEPYFRCRDFLRVRGVAVFSSNYGLYADISNRVMQTIATFAPALEVYSIDECFVDAGGFSGLEALGREWRQVIRRWTGITCGIGFGPSKTLAKLANHAAKQYPKTGGVVDLSDPVRQRRLLAITPVEDVWGIGRRLGQHLRALGIQTALQLADSHPGWIRQRFNVVLARTVAELNGQSCLQLEEVRPPKQQIISSRSFSSAITDPEALCEAVAEYTARAAEKLRQEKQECRMVTVFARSAHYGQRPYSAQRTVALAASTADTRDLLRAVRPAALEIFRAGVKFAKAGVLLSEFSRGERQPPLFAVPGIRNDHRLMQVIDALNQRKRHDVFLAAQGIGQPWAMRRDMLSPAYTTRWEDLPRCQ